jgi:hypothetical protein
MTPGASLRQPSIAKWNWKSEMERSRDGGLVKQPVKSISHFPLLTEPSTEVFSFWRFTQEFCYDDLQVEVHAVTS